MSCSFVASRPRTCRVRIGWSPFLTIAPWTGGHGGTNSSNLFANQLVPGVLAWHRKAHGETPRAIYNIAKQSEKRLVEASRRHTPASRPSAGTPQEAERDCQWAARFWMSSNVVPCPCFILGRTESVDNKTVCRHCHRKYNKKTIS